MMLIGQQKEWVKMDLKDFTEFVDALEKKAYNKTIEYSTSNLGEKPTQEEQQLIQLAEEYHNDIVEIYHNIRDIEFDNQELLEEVESLEDEVEELKKEIGDLEFDIEKLKDKIEELESQLSTE